MFQKNLKYSSPNLPVNTKDRLILDFDDNFVFSSYSTTERWCSNWPGINCIAAGFEYHFYDETYLWMNLYPKNYDWKKYFDPEFKMLEIEPRKWYEEVKTAPSLFKVLFRLHNDLPSCPE